VPEGFFFLWTMTGSPVTSLFHSSPSSVIRWRHGGWGVPGLVASYDIQPGDGVGLFQTKKPTLGCPADHCPHLRFDFFDHTCIITFCIIIIIIIISSAPLGQEASATSRFQWLQHTRVVTSRLICLTVPPVRNMVYIHHSWVCWMHLRYYNHTQQKAQLSLTTTKRLLYFVLCAALWCIKIMMIFILHR